MWVIAADQEWVQRHGEFRDGGWVCKKTGKDINVMVTGRSIWEKPFSGGSGEVRQVGHLYCTGCPEEKPEPKVNYGEPIYEDALCQVS